MTCCILGMLVTSVVVWVTSFVRFRLLGRERPPDPTAWHLDPPRDGAS
jgi:hypothetical protein